MQRLFSMFPAGRPGLALLLLRVALAIMLMQGVAGKLWTMGPPWFVAAPVAVAVALCIGFLMPVVTVSTVVLEVAVLASTDMAIDAVHVCAVLNAIALTLLGPGAYSLDARLFGRRRVFIRTPDDPSGG
jgi:hypothetical protein